MVGPAATPEPPYFAVIFTSLRTADDAEGYAQMSQLLDELAAAQPGFLGIESTRGSDGVGITVSYWQSRQAIAAWREEATHQVAQRLGHDRWYQWYHIRICEVFAARGSHALDEQ